MNIIDVIHDLFQQFASRLSWIGILKAIFGLPMDDVELAFFRRHTARALAPTRQFSTVLIEAGRRAGKSITAALIAVFMGCFRDHSGVLAPGERAVVMVIAADTSQAKVVFRYIVALLNSVPMLAALVERKTADTIDLSNQVSIEVRTASFRTVRGRTIVCCICDEIAFWRDESSANPDTEILNALRPAMATIPDALLLLITTTYSPRGVAWEMDRRYFGVEDEHVLVIRSDTRSLNPTIPQSIIDRAFEEDEAVAWSEYGRDGEIRFRTDVAGFIDRAAVDAVVPTGRFELPPIAGNDYCGFVDPSGGVKDSMTLAIAHEIGRGQRVLDLLREVKPPFSPDEVCREFAETLKRYGCLTVSGDFYGGIWPSERFAVHGIRYLPSEKTKSELFLELLPAINSGRVELLDNSRLISQLCHLERRTSRSGKDSIDHAPGGHDDLANSAAGAIVYSKPVPKYPATTQRFAEYDFNPLSPAHGEEGEGDEQVQFYTKR